MYGQNRGLTFVLFLIYALFGLYFLNGQLNFVKIPETFAQGELWIIFVGGILLIIAGIKFLIKRRY